MFEKHKQTLEGGLYLVSIYVNDPNHVATHGPSKLHDVARLPLFLLKRYHVSICPAYSGPPHVDVSASEPIKGKARQGNATPPVWVLSPEAGPFY